MISNRPNISVILPVYNGERFIKSALNNLREQQYPELEVIIIDDGSTDNSEAIAKDFILQNTQLDCHYNHQAHAGVASARNLGLQHANSDWIAFLDVDDLWPKNKLESHLKRFAKAPELIAVLGMTQFVDIAPTNHQETQGVNCAQMLLGAGLYKRSMFDQVGEFDTTLVHGEDWDWFLRCREASAAIRVFSCDSGLIYRRHSDNLSLKKTGSQHDLMRLLKQSLDRRRQSDSPNKTNNGKQAEQMDTWSSIIDSSTID